MAMQMQRAFNARMLTKLTLVTVTPGTYDEDNHWVNGATVSSDIWGVVKAGNKFSQFDEGEALHSEDGGARYSDYRTLYVTDLYPIQLQDKILYRNIYYNVIQRSDERVYGFYSVLIEKTQEWTP